MIASIPYRAMGNEVVESGTTLVNFAPCSGNVIIDVLLNGFSQEFGVDVEVDNLTGNVLFNTAMERGDHALVIYKTLPRLATATSEMVDFEPADFSETDFA
jgi:hypothetical protein